jgi:hypothetical protein
LKKLRTLGLESPKIRDEGIANIKGCATLQELSLFGTGNTDRIIDALPNFPALRKFNIPNSKLTLDGLRRLRDKYPKLVVH